MIHLITQAKARLLLQIVFWFVISSLLPQNANAQPKKDLDPLSYDRNIGGLISKYCYKCHNEEKASGDVNLAKDSNPRLIIENAVIWQTAADRMEADEMPPKEAKQPSKEERELITKFIHLTLGELNCDVQDNSSRRDPGKPTIRRLNRAEYNNSILYLTGLDLRLADSFPADTTSYGFDNIAESLTLTPLQVEQYYAAAHTIVKELLMNKNSDSPVGYGQVFFTDSQHAGSNREAAKQIVQRFANRALRRPAQPDWIDKLLGIYDRSLEQKNDHETAVGNMLATVLVSPRFLMRFEIPKPDLDQPFPVDDFDLASRLSFFLWSGPPDEILFDLAEQSSLSKPEQLDAQVKRMLADPRSDALIDNFFAPWLQFDEVTAHEPNLSSFPNFTPELREAIAKEPRWLLTKVIREDLPILDLIDSKYTFVNETLAAHYGIDNIHGAAMQRIDVSDRRRGGLLTTAALLMVQADPTRTNVPRRGNFIAGTILGSPAPPPPPNVPELQTAAGADQPQTLRARLEIHRSDASCAACHAKIDPLGFSLENYDAIGRWREADGGKPIDASGELPGGRKFNGPIELKDILLERKAEFAATFAKQMLIYALGRGPVLADKCVVQDAVDAARKNDFRFSAVVKSIVHSYPFLHRRNPEY